MAPHALPCEILQKLALPGGRRPALGELQKCHDDRVIFVRFCGISAFGPWKNRGSLVQHTERGGKNRLR